MDSKLKADQAIADFGSALTFFTRGVDRLRQVSPDHANHLSQLVNALTQALIRAVGTLDEGDSPSTSPTQERSLGLDGTSKQPENLALHQSDGMATRGKEQTSSQYTVTPTLDHSRLSTPALTHSPNNAWNVKQAVNAFNARPDTNSAGEGGQSWPEVTTAAHKERRLVLYAPDKAIPVPAPAPAPLAPSTSTKSWATVAALDPSAQAKLANRIANNSSPSTIPFQEKAPVPSEPLSRQNRAVWIVNLPSKTNLRSISSIVYSGPLNSINFCPYPTDKDRSACVIFKDAKDAEAFKSEIDIDFLHRVWGPKVGILEGLPFPMDASIQMMDSPIMARRRLTIVRSRLFANLHEDDFRRDIREWAGPENVEVVFIYNLGNATVILASVQCAEIVKKKIELKARVRGAYTGALVSYSKDPTEAPIRLVTSTPKLPIF
ncbi:MAG: hypothetical protein M1814_001254 [Vezdaea aestivalis]|nr:MAG: hypothetical protein M1814_001254 [Vezdaea aestivalis]